MTSGSSYDDSYPAIWSSEPTAQSVEAVFPVMYTDTDGLQVWEDENTVYKSADGRTWIKAYDKKPGGKGKKGGKKGREERGPGAPLVDIMMPQAAHSDAGAMWILRQVLARDPEQVLIRPIGPCVTFCFGVDG